MHNRAYLGQDMGQKIWEMIKLRGRKFICFLFNGCVICEESSLHGITKICVRVTEFMSFKRS